MYNYFLVNILDLTGHSVCFILTFSKVTHKKSFSWIWNNCLFNMIFNGAIQTKANDLTIFNIFKLKKNYNVPFISNYYLVVIMIFSISMYFHFISMSCKMWESLEKKQQSFSIKSSILMNILWVTTVCQGPE